jgi:hypothetical protein
MTDGDEAEGGDADELEDVDVEVNEDAVEDERDRRTVQVEVPIDEVHATAVETLEDAGVDVEGLLESRLQPSAENSIHQILQEAKYSE